jgi:hypothetical protein
VRHPSKAAQPSLAADIAKPSERRYPNTVVIRKEVPLKSLICTRQPAGPHVSENRTMKAIEATIKLQKSFGYRHPE